MRENLYFEYESMVSYIQDYLGIGDVVDYILDKRNKHYIFRILKYLQYKFQELGTDAETIDKIYLVRDLREWVCKKILGHRIEEVSECMQFDLGCGCHNGEVPHLDTETDFVILAWELADILSSLYTRLKILYASLLSETTDSGCSCRCARGESQNETWDNWTSGVYTEDENLEYLDATQSVSSSGGIGSCGCSYRTT